MTLPEAETEGSVLYKACRFLDPIYAGGRIEVLPPRSSEGEEPSQNHHMAMMRVGSRFALRDALSGRLIHSLDVAVDEEDAGITAFTMKDARTMLSVNTSNIIEVWDVVAAAAAAPLPIRSWKVLRQSHHYLWVLLLTFVPRIRPTLRPFWS